MTPAEAAATLAALNWSSVPHEHQIAVSGALETLKTLAPPSNVIPLPVRPRTKWTKICQLDGREWASSTHFEPGGAWDWIVETVMHEQGVSEERVSSLEGSEDQFDGDDIVTVDGLPVYRIRCEWC